MILVYASMLSISVFQFVMVHSPLELPLAIGHNVAGIPSYSPFCWPSPSAWVFHSLALQASHLRVQSSIPFQSTQSQHIHKLLSSTHRSYWTSLQFPAPYSLPHTEACPEGLFYSLVPFQKTQPQDGLPGPLFQESATVVSLVFQA